MQTRRTNPLQQRSVPAPNGRTTRYIVYPESNGKPIAESQIHVERLLRCLALLEALGAGDPLFFVAADLFLYFEEGNPAACVAPDLFVVKGVAKRPLRNSYKLWAEQVAPCFVMELTSPFTAAEDRLKLALYARLGVGDCFLYDPRPLVRRRTPALQGYRLGASGYEPIPVEPDGSLVSQELGLRLIVENERLELYDQVSDERLLDPRERALVAEQRLADEVEACEVTEQRAAAAERRITELEALLLEQRPPA